MGTEGDAGRERLQSCLGLLSRVFDEAALEPAMTQGAALLAHAAGAEHAAIFLAGDGQPLREYGAPSPSDEWTAVRPTFKRLAEEATRSGARTIPVVVPIGANQAVVRAYPVATHGRTLGAVSLLWTAPEPASGSEGREQTIATLSQIIADKASVLEQLAASRAGRERDERWFRTLDGHLRVLERERQKFTAIVNQTDTLVFVTDPSRTIRWINRAMTRLFPEESGEPSWIGKPCGHLCAQLGRACDPCPVERALLGRDVAHYEMAADVKGTTGLLYLTALPILGPTGRVDEVMVQIQDLTRLEHLRRSESRYRLLFERNADSIVMVDPSSYRIVLANGAACGLFAYSSAELLDRTLADLHSPEEWDRMRDRYRDCFAEEAANTRECAVRTRFGEECIAQVWATRFLLEGNEVLMINFRDITEQRWAERALLRAEERLRAVVASSPIVLFAIDRSGVFTLSEGRGLDSLGLKPGEVVGQSVFTLYRDAPEILTHIRRALAGETFDACVDVGSLTFETRYAALRDPDGSIQGVIGVATDISERRRAERALQESEAALRRSEEQLRHAQKMEAVGVLAGGVAHDFNNLLTIILTQSELLMASLPAGSTERAKAEEIQTAGQRGAMLTRQLLTFSRSEVLAPRVWDLNVVVGDMEQMLRRLIGEDVELTWTPAPCPATVRADRGQLEQILMNLAVNARDAMPGGGKLAIELSCVTLDGDLPRELAATGPGRYCVLSARDSGHGMEAETRERIFEPFFTTKERGKGTGLGLSTVYGIVKQSSGMISVASEPGSWTQFTIHLPLQEPEQAPPPLASRGRASPGSETVLLAEDEPGVRAIGRELLALNGYLVLEAENGVEALEVAARHQGPIHLLLTDVVMPRMGGRELAERLAAARPGIRLLFISGFTDDTVVRHGVLDAGVAFLQKPFTLESLSLKVREVLDAPAPTPAAPSP